MATFNISDRSLGGYRSAVTRKLSSAKAAVSVANPVLVTVKSNVELLQARWNKYLEVWDEYISERESLSDEAYSTLERKHADFETAYDVEANKIFDILGQLQNAVPGNSVTSQNSVKIRLPEVKINNFSGKLEEWQTWWDSYRSLVHDRKDMDKVLKMTHLKSCLTGKALLVVSGFQITEQDYDDAIAALHDKFANPERVRQTLVLQLLDMPKPKNTAKDLEHFKLDFERIMKTLEHYVNDLHSSHWLISILLQNKLPTEAEMFIFQKFQTKYFSLDQLSTGLADHLEFLDKKPDSGKLSVKDKPRVLSDTQQVSSNKTQVGTYSVDTKTFKSQCLLCSSEDHRAKQCSQYSDAASRRERLTKIGKCSRCLRVQHDGKCTQLVKCNICHKGNHNEIFCYSNFKTKIRDITKTNNTAKPKSVSVETNTEVNSVVMSNQCSSHKHSSALATAQVKVSNHKNSESVITRCFFDPGSQISFITAKLANTLQLETVETRELVLQGFHSKPTEGKFPMVKPLVSLGKRVKKISVAVVDRLPNSISAPGLVSVHEMLQNEGIKLADEISSDTISDIELMIGSDFFADFVGGVSKHKDVSLFHTSGGSIPFGKLPSSFSNNSSSPVQTNVLVCRLTVNDSPISVTDIIDENNEPVHKLWELESIGIDPAAPSVEDDCAYKGYVNSVEYRDGQYFVRLPWRKNCPSLPNNYRMALGQIYSLRSNLSKFPGRLDEYHKIIQDQLNQHFIEKVPSAVVSANTHYVPHHCVIKDSATTPLRIVYNCSAQEGKGSPSLNDCLIKGPSLTEKLGDVLLKFRVNDFAFCADISKAFLRVGLQSVDRDYVRFLWFKDPHNPEIGLDTYRFASVLFGSTSSPFLLMATLDYHLSKSDSRFKNLIAKSFYVDNLQGTMSDEEDLLMFYAEANKEMEKANMPLRTWVTNNEKLKKQIENDYDNYVVPASATVLGLKWDVDADLLSLKPVNLFVPEVITKRKLLSLVSTVFDPLGLYAPVIIKGKILIQAAWKTNSSWNDPLEDEFLNGWSELNEDFKGLSNLPIPRKVATDGLCYMLHVFCDSSTKAYGCAAYLVGDEGSNLVIAKAKVAPLKSKTLPQLELTAIWLGFKVANYIHRNLCDIDITKTVIWSDNEAAIQWVRNNNSTITYVKNRVADIKEMSNNYQIFHVSTGDNPADLVTRGISVSYLANNSLWFKGPLWLPFVNLWPDQRNEVVVYEITAERKPDPITIESLFAIKDYSSFDKVRRVTKYVFQFLNKLLHKLSRSNILMTAVPNPVVYWFRYSQLMNFGETFSWLFYSESRDSVKFHSLYNILQKPSCLSKECQELIRDLGLYFDEVTGVIRSRGRLKHSEIAVTSKYPILMASKDHISELFIERAHKYNLHGGVQETLASVRQQLWIPKGRQAVRNVIRKCVTCRKVEGKHYEYPGPPSLPLHRVVLNRPFETVGVDYSGPIVITKTENGEPRKVYICLFTCTSTRAIHLEVALDMSAESFLLVFRRFCGSWSVPKQIISDNGTNFKATAKFLEQMSDDPQVQNYCGPRGIIWKFIAPRAPWQGGFYERMIKIVKNCLRKVLYRKRVSLDELQTVVVEIQSRVNNRPLTYINSSRDSPEPLTPSHLLYGRRIEAMPSLVFGEESDPSYMDHHQLNRHFSLLSCIISKFEKLWKQEYIVSLRERHYGSNKAKEFNDLKRGDVVLVQTDSPRGDWPLGRIVLLRPDSEGVIRSVDVYCRGHVNTRTVEKLIPLEISDPVDDQLLDKIDNNLTGMSDIEQLSNKTADHVEMSEQETPPSSDTVPEGRPQRASGIRATLERRELIKHGLL